MRELYGDSWQGPAARALGILPRPLQRMASGEHHAPSGGPWPIPFGVWRELAEMLEAERDRLAELAAKAREWAG